MQSQLEKPLERGIKIDVSAFPADATVELFGHVTLVECYALPT